MSRLRALLIREIKFTVFWGIAVAIALWALAYETCIFHALTGR